MYMSYHPLEMPGSLSRSRPKRQVLKAGLLREQLLPSHRRANNHLCNLGRRSQTIPVMDPISRILSIPPLRVSDSLPSRRSCASLNRIAGPQRGFGHAFVLCPIPLPILLPASFSPNLKVVHGADHNDFGFHSNLVQQGCRQPNSALAINLAFLAEREEEPGKRPHIGLGRRRMPYSRRESVKRIRTVDGQATVQT